MARKSWSILKKTIDPPMNESDIKTLTQRWREQTEKALDKWLPEEKIHPVVLHKAMRYSVQNGGKRVRPLLVYAAGECLGVDPAHLDAPGLHIFARKALPKPLIAVILPWNQVVKRKRFLTPTQATTDTLFLTSHSIQTKDTRVKIQDIVKQSSMK